MLSCWKFVLWSSTRYMHANTANPQLKFEIWSNSLNNGKNIKCMRLADVSGINMLPISMRMCARAYCPMVAKFTSSGNSWNLLFSHDSFMRFPVIIFLGGISPNKSWHNCSRFLELPPVTGSPSIGTPNCSETSSRVTVVSPSGMSKVWVSVLHLSHNVVTMRWLISTLLTFKTWPKPAASINILTLGSIRSVCFKIQIEWRHGRRTLSFPSQIWLVMWSSWWRNTDNGKAIINYVKVYEKITRISFKVDE